MTLKRGKDRGKDRLSHKHSIHSKGQSGSLKNINHITHDISHMTHELEEEFFLPAPIHRGKYRLPLGIRFLIGYLFFLSLLYVISFAYGVSFPTTIILGTIIEGNYALIINCILLAIILVMVYGFWKRKAYTFDLSLCFFSFTAINALVSFIMFDSADHPILKKLLLLSFVSLVLMNAVIINYLLHERRFFYARVFRDSPFHHRDKVFLYTIISFWTITLLIGITLGVTFYNDTTKIVDSVLAEMKGNYFHGQLVCEAKSGPERDVCYLVLATVMSKQKDPISDPVSVCDNIRSDFYRFTCKRSITSR
jgi:hypothetical protein